MGSMCSTEKEIPCIFNGDIITCQDIISKKIKIYQLDDQNEIQYIDKTYKKDKKWIVEIINLIQIFLFCLIAYLFFLVFRHMCNIYNISTPFFYNIFINII
jgi:hypothetical protein